MAVPMKKETQGDIMEQVLLKGDIAKLTPDERVRYYSEVCHSMGLNPLTKPFEFITLNNKLQLYALRSCTDQLRKINNVSLEIVSQEVKNDILTIHVRARMPDGRTDEDLGAVPFSDLLKGEARVNAELKAVTKAKRRATLSICGLGWLDETEIETIPAHAKTVSPPSPTAATAVPSKAPSSQDGTADPDLFHDAGVYVLKWEQIINAATNAAKLKKQWLDEEQERKRIEWPPKAREALQMRVVKALEYLAYEKAKM